MTPTPQFAECPPLASSSEALRPPGSTCSPERALLHPATEGLVALLAQLAARQIAKGQPH